jgi:uncharacterized protein YjgD (DUF1641 family)
MVAMLKLAKKMSDPKTLEFFEKITSVPANVDLDNIKKIGPFGMISAGFDSEVKQGLGVMMALTKAMGKIQSNGNGQQRPELPQEAPPE